MHLHTTEPQSADPLSLPHTPVTQSALRLDASLPPDAGPCSIARNRERLLALGIPSLVKELQGTAAVAAGGKPKKKRAKSERGPRVKREAGAPEQPSRRSSRLQEAAEHEKEEEETGEAAVMGFWSGCKGLFVVPLPGAACSSAALCLDSSPASLFPAPNPLHPQTHALTTHPPHPFTHPSPAWLGAAEEQLQRELGQAVVEGQCPRCGKALERGHRQHLLACTGVAKAPCQPRPRDADDLAVSQGCGAGRVAGGWAWRG